MREGGIIQRPKHERESIEREIRKNSRKGGNLINSVHNITTNQSNFNLPNN